MATNLVTLIMQFLTPDMISKIASSIGLDQSEAQKAAGVGVPAILAGLANAAMNPQNQQRLSDAMTQQSAALDQTKSAISGGEAKSLADGGGNMLSSLLGGGASNAIANAVGRFAGINSDASSSLLGMLAPIVAGVVGREQRSAGLDASGLANLLTSQSRQITAAMPANFSNMLSGTGVMDNLEDTWRRGTGAAASAADHVSDMAGRANADAGRWAARASQATLSYWPILGLALLGLFGLGWFLVGGDNRQTVAERPITTTTRSAETVGSGAPHGRTAELTSEVTSSVNDARSALLGIADPASIRDALPKLRQVTDRFETINNAVSQLPADARKGVSSAAAQSLPALNQLCERILASPQTSDVAKPAIDAFRVQLNMLVRS